MSDGALTVTMSAPCSCCNRLIKGTTTMGKVLIQVSIAVLVAACTTAHPERQEPSSVALPATGHPSGAMTAEGAEDFVVTLWGVPLNIAADFVPG
jgi:hypothetical protein